MPQPHPACQIGTSEHPDLALPPPMTYPGPVITCRCVTTSIVGRETCTKRPVGPDDLRRRPVDDQPKQLDSCHVLALPGGAVTGDRELAGLDRGSPGEVASWAEDPVASTRGSSSDG